MKVREMCIFAMLGSLMFCSKLIMEMLPNIHLLGMFIGAFTVAYGKKALIPIYIFVMITGVYAGFSTWWIPYVYIWAVLWGMFILIPRRIPRKLAMVVYPTVSCIHGVLFGVLYAPTQALIFGFNFEQTLAWIGAGFAFDILHGIGNFAAGFLILPLSDLMIRLDRVKY